jgi:hypothetical protein
MMMLSNEFLKRNELAETLGTIFVELVQLAVCQGPPTAD